MGKFIDLTGQTFNKWKVIKLSNKIGAGGVRYWTCECQCENKTIRDVSGASLRQGKSKSCGCLIKEKTPPNFIDLTGKTFDRLTVLEITNKRSQNGNIIWKCRCKCGNICERNTANLLRKNERHSCGCYNIEKISAKNPDLTNKTFGLLTVIKLTNEIDNSHGRLWECRCQCGNIIKVRTNSLTTSNTSSCGCINYSIGEKHIEEILKSNNIDFKAQYTTKELKKKRFDFAILKDNNVIRLIEFDGQQHYTDSSGIWNSNETLKDIQQRDKEKNQYALSHNIPLVRIPYWERDNITLEMLFSDEYLVKEEDE